MGADLVHFVSRDTLPVAAREIAPVVSFFHAYPRLLAAQTEFATSQEYRIGIYRLGIPYLVTGVVLVVAALVANFYFLARKGVIPGADDTHESNPNDRDGTSRAFLFFSAFLNLAILVCIGLAFSSFFAMRSAAGSAYDTLDNAKAHISRNFEAPGYTLQSYAAQASKVNLDTVEEDIRDNLRGIVTLFTKRKVHFDNLVSRSVDWFGRLDAIRDEIKRLATRYVLFTVALVFTCLGGLFLSFACDVTVPDSRRIKYAAFSLLLIPLAATWAHTAVSTWLVVAAADFCESLDQYHQAVRTESKGGIANISSSNIFVQYELQCPPVKTGVGRDLAEANEFLGSASRMQPGFERGLDAITNKQVSIEQWEEAREYLQDIIIESRKCDTQINMAHMLSYHMCGSQGFSGVSATAQLWLCSFGLSLLFTAIVAILSFGHPPSEFCSGRELMCIYGAPKLISAFGDVRSVLKKHATFKKLQSEKYQWSDISSTSSDLDAMEHVARDYNFDDSFDDDSTMSTTRPRRNAYTSHPLKDQSGKRSDWSIDFSRERDDDSTDSSSLS